MDKLQLLNKILCHKRFQKRPEVVMPLALAGTATRHFLAAAFIGLTAICPARAEVTPFSQSLAFATAEREDIAAFYLARNYAPVWTTAEAAPRRAALLAALSAAGDHGLPVSQYNVDKLVRAFQTAETEGDRGRLEFRMTRLFLAYVRDMKMGVVVPAKVDPLIKIERPDHDGIAQLQAFLLAPQPGEWLRDLAPKSPEYARLMAEKIALEDAVARGGWGPVVTADALAPGAAGDAVVALRNRLMTMGYLGRSVTGSYDRSMQSAVQRFQIDHGLVADGVAGAGTVDEINLGADARLKSVVVALERRCPARRAAHLGEPAGFQRKDRRSWARDL
jgi:L,D-transpeptidase YcbB